MDVSGLSCKADISVPTVAAAHQPLARPIEGEKEFQIALAARAAKMDAGDMIQLDQTTSAARAFSARTSRRLPLVYPLQPGGEDASHAHTAHVAPAVGGLPAMLSPPPPPPPPPPPSRAPMVSALQKGLCRTSTALALQTSAVTASIYDPHGNVGTVERESAGFCQGVRSQDAAGPLGCERQGDNIAAAPSDAGNEIAVAEDAMDREGKWKGPQASAIAATMAGEPQVSDEDRGPTRPTKPPPLLPAEAHTLVHAPRQTGTLSVSLSEAVPRPARPPPAVPSVSSTAESKSEDPPIDAGPEWGVGQVQQAEKEVQETEWYAYVDDDSGEVYYYNPATQQTEWDLPLGGRVIEQDQDEMGEVGQDGGIEMENEQREEAPPSDETLHHVEIRRGVKGGEDVSSDSSGWSSSDDEEGSHASTIGEHASSDGTEAVSMEDVARQGLGDSGDVVLPEGWEVLIDDDTGVDYFHHLETGHVQWELPATELSPDSLPVSVSESEALSSSMPSGRASPLQSNNSSLLQEKEHVSQDQLRHATAVPDPGPNEDDISRAKGDLEDLKVFMAKLVLGNDFSGGVHGDTPALTVSLVVLCAARGVCVSWFVCLFVFVIVCLSVLVKSVIQRVCRQ